MKKVMLFALGILMTGASAFAQEVVKSAKDSTSTSVSSKSNVDPVKTEIKASELPQPVKDLASTFKSQGWDIADNAFAVKDATDQVAFYIVTFKNLTSGESKSVNIDAKGKIVK